MNQNLYYGKIRSNFLSWIKKEELSKFILNVEQASIKYGADGAFFVYLRKLKILIFYNFKKNILKSNFNFRGQQ